ncbi:MAG: DUF1080 domain-containing protein [Cyclobacteriaceae bacterium]|nr:DUF1080 domain-containing protein [Cyclobacteriaceae bacterium]
MKVYITSLILAVLSISGLIAQPIKIDLSALQSSKPWAATEQWEPKPPKVTPGMFTLAPSDAIVLFDGKDLDAWHKPKYGYGTRMDEVESIIKWKADHPENSAAEWIVKDGQMIVKPGAGAIETNLAFGDVQLHIEWLAPVDPGKESQGYSNSGIFLMGMYELQVLNSYENETYSNGQAGSMYKQLIPLVNASRPPGEWQSYDIVFTAPRFNEDGTLKSPATITVFHNGLLIQNHAVLKGPCVYIGTPYYFKHPEKLPLLLQDHGNKVRFRNIWIREL